MSYIYFLSFVTILLFKNIMPTLYNNMNLTKTYLIKNYVTNEKTIAQISKETGYSRYRVTQAISSFNIALRKPKSHDLRGQSFGNWTVLDKTKNGKCRAKCSCGTIKQIHTSSLIYGRTTKCYLCRSNLKTGQENPKWTGFKQISGSLWRQFKSSAKNRNILFDVSIEEAWLIFESQKAKCALSGIELIFGKTIYEQRDGATTASLDRIDSNGNYTKDNVQWVHKTINRMKNTVPEIEFIEFCKLVAKHNA